MTRRWRGCWRVGCDAAFGCSCFLASRDGACGWALAVSGPSPLKCGDSSESPKARSPHGCFGSFGDDGGDRVRPACAFRGWAAEAPGSWLLRALWPAVAGCGELTPAAGIRGASSTSRFRKFLHASAFAVAVVRLMHCPVLNPASLRPSSTSSSPSSRLDLVGAPAAFVASPRPPQPGFDQVLFNILVVFIEPEPRL